MLVGYTRVPIELKYTVLVDCVRVGLIFKRSYVFVSVNMFAQHPGPQGQPGSPQACT